MTERRKRTSAPAAAEPLAIGVEADVAARGEDAEQTLAPPSWSAREASALTADQQHHLQAYALVNPRHALNERCYQDVDTFRQMSITFQNLRANSKAFLSLGDGQHAIWSEGGGDSKMVGLRFSTSAPALNLRSFLINAREMILETFADCEQLTIGLYVRTEQAQVRGRVDLPPGASVTLQSRCDRTSLIGLSSFAVALE